VHDQAVDQGAGAGVDVGADADGGGAARPGGRVPDGTAAANGTAAAPDSVVPGSAAGVTERRPTDPPREPVTEPMDPVTGSVGRSASAPVARPANTPMGDSRGDPVTEPIPAQDDAPPADPGTPTGPGPRGWEALSGAVRDHAAFVLVLLVLAVGGIRMLEYHWRQGSGLIGGALILAALFRALLPDSRAGLLVVRGRPVDVLSYAGLGAVTLWVALTLTGGPFG
jgi:Protein of unknown function (DUF3017)